MTVSRENESFPTQSRRLIKPKEMSSQVLLVPGWAADDNLEQKSTYTFMSLGGQTYLW